VHLAQADINNLPFKQCFDYAFSVGVLHHTDKPKNSFLSLVKTVRPGGSVSIWVYGKENNGWITNLLNPFRIFVTCKLPVAFTRFIAFVMASILFVWVNAVIRPWAQLQKALPFLPSFFYQDYLYYISEFDFNEIHHITFDHLVAPVAYYIPESEVRQWLNEAKLENTVIRWHNKNSWAGFGNVCSEKKELKTDLAKQKLQSVN
jgi:SAM-dependent methyltransferase